MENQKSDTSVTYQDPAAIPIRSNKELFKELAAINRFDAAVFDLLIDTERKNLFDLIKVFDRYATRLSPRAYWFLLSMIWTRFPDPNQGDLWGKLFSSEKPGREFFMKGSEFRIFHKLPSLITAYRPHIPHELWFISFDLSATIAREKAIETKTHGVASFVIQKSAAFAVLNRGRGAELIVHPGSFVDRVHISPLEDRTLR